MDEKLRDNQPIAKKDKLRKAFSRTAAAFVSVAVLIVGTAFKNTLNPMSLYNTFFVEPTISYNFSKYKVEGIAVYYGTLVNDSSNHAKDITLKGKFNTEIMDFEISTNDSIEKTEKNNPRGSIEFSLKRLSGKSRCDFSIVVRQDGEIKEQITASWGDKGRLLLDLQKSDENIVKGIELSDLSRKARQRWLENNTKNIRK